MNGEAAGDFVCHPRVVSRALKRSALVDPFLCSRYSFSPYMACGHACRYCDGRSEKYWVEGDFGRDIVVRSNIVALLQDEIPRLRERAPVAVGSGISDAYQPIEESQRIMQQCALCLADSGLPASVLTKSALVMRDIDSWDRVNRSSGFVLNLSIATLDDAVRRRFEPRASSIDERLDTIRAFRRRGIPVGVMAMPLLPFLSDSEADITALVSTLKDAGVAFVMGAGLTLRPGRQKDLFLSSLADWYPDLLPHYRQLYSEERLSGAATTEYRRELQRRVDGACRSVGVPPLLPHALYRGRLPLYDELHLLLQHMGELYAARGVPTAALKAARQRYSEWLLRRKKAFNRKRSQSPGGIEEEVRGALRLEDGGTLLGNARLAAFLRRVAFEKEVLDYTTLTLCASADAPRLPAPVPRRYI